MSRSRPRPPLVLSTGLAACALLTTLVVPAAAGAAGRSPAVTAAPRAAAPATVKVTLTEFHIALSRRQLEPGRHTFAVRNAGTITHGFTVDGKGVHDKHIPLLKPGKSARLTVTLVKGRYTVFCPVGDHRMAGMHAVVRVG